MTVTSANADPPSHHPAGAVRALHGTNRHQLAEGPQWWPDQTLTWVDIPAGTLTIARPDTDAGHTRIHRIHHVPGHLGTAVRCSMGGFLLAIDQTLAHCGEDGEVAHLATIDSGPTRLNDGKCDPVGRFWVGSMSTMPGHGSLFRIDIDGSISRAVTGLTISNGIGWSPDRTVMYLADSTPGTIDAFDYDLATGAVDNRRTIVTVRASSGAVDGLTVDADGCIWVAIWDGAAIHRYDPNGQLISTLPLPTRRPTACCFGGPDGATLWITTASQGLPALTAGDGMVLHYPSTTTGPPAQPFTGDPSMIGH